MAKGTLFKYGAQTPPGTDTLKFRQGGVIFSDQVPDSRQKLSGSKQHTEHSCDSSSAKLSQAITTKSPAKESTLSIKKAWERYVAEVPYDQNEITAISFNILRRGKIPSVPQVANVLDKSRTEIESLLLHMAGNGSVTLEDGLITGVGGLSSTPTMHRLVLDGVELYCWCALDTLGIPAALVADASIVSPDTNGGNPIALRFERGRLAQATEKILLQLAPPDQARLLCGGT